MSSKKEESSCENKKERDPKEKENGFSNMKLPKQKLSGMVLNFNFANSIKGKATRRKVSRKMN